MYKQLFIPGPTGVTTRGARKDNAHDWTPHGEATELQKYFEKLQKLMYTENTILLSASSGTGLMEAAIRCCTRKRAAVFSVGALVTAGISLQKTTMSLLMFSNRNPVNLPHLKWSMTP